MSAVVGPETGTAVTPAVPAGAGVRRRTSFRAVFGLAVLLLMSGAAIAAPRIAPWDPGRQMLAKRLRPPAWHKMGEL